MASMVNMNSLLNGKDSRWLQLEVCREFQRNKCSRPDTECKFAHPPANVEVQNGRVTACYDSIKGRCNREKPPCKYFHPPQHLKDQLLINGRNHLALKNALMQQMGIAPGQPVLPGQVPTVAANPYLTGMPTSTYSPYFAPGHLVPALLGPDPSTVASPLGHTVVPQAVPVAQQKIPRSDRLESAPVSTATATGSLLTAASMTPMAAQPGTTSATAAMSLVGHPLEIGKKRAAENDMFQLMDMKSVGSFYYDNFAFPGMGVPFKRPAADKSGIPVYQPSATTYQQLMQLQQPFVPVSCEYPSPSPSATLTTNPQSSTANPISNNNNINAIVNNSNNSLTTTNSNSNPVVTSSPQNTYSNHVANPETDLQSEQKASSPTAAEQPATTTVLNTPLATISNPQTPTIASTTPYAVVPYSSVTYSAMPYSTYTNSAIYSHPLTASSSNQTSFFADPAAIAKEVAQKNYANALKLAAASNAYSGKPLTALSYTGVALNKALMPTQQMTSAQQTQSQQQQHHHQQQQHHHHQQQQAHQQFQQSHLMQHQQQQSTQSQTHSQLQAHVQAQQQLAAANQAQVARQMTAAAMNSATSPVSQSPFAALSRPPPMFVQSNQYFRHNVSSGLPQNPVHAAVAAAAAQQQLLSQNFFYSGLQHYPLGLSAAAMQAHLPSPVPPTMPGLQTVPTVPQVPTVTPGAAVVLNPYKKMKTS